VITVSLGVSDFALPSPLKGSIDTYSGFGGGKEIGNEIHKRHQEKQSQNNEDYRSEVVMLHSFHKEEFIFEVAGRADGFYDKDFKIEEIKSSFNVYELMKRLKEDFETHPYILQLQTYGYITFLQTQKIPNLSLHLISSRNGEAIDVNVKLEIGKYESWLNLRLGDLILEARRAVKRSKRRKTSSRELTFPFKEPRLGQTELIDTIEQGIKQTRPSMIQAPTGLGKTIGVIYPLLKDSLSRGQQLFYVTPKNSQHAVAEDAMERLRENGAKIKSMTFTAKSKMCLKNEPICNPEFCEYANNHYTKVGDNNLADKLSKKKNLNSKIFRNMAAEFEVCPFELQILAATEADSIICDYNYVFAPRSALGRVSGIEVEQIEKPNLAVDEAHNLISRSLDYYSPELSITTLENMRSDFLKLNEKFSKKALRLLDDCINVLISLGSKDSRAPSLITPPFSKFLEQDNELKEYLSNYLKSDAEILPRDPVMNLCFYWGEFTEALQFIESGRREFFTTFHPQAPTIKITCCDASVMLKSCYEKFSNVVSFSATLKPFDYYSQLSGLKDLELKTSEFMSPFPKSNRKLILIPQISSKYSERDRNYHKIAETIEKIAFLKEGNYFSFFPSFDFMNKVLKIFNPPKNFEVLKQYPQMGREGVNDILDRLKTRNLNHIVFGVQGGILSEGIDYPGSMSIGAFIIGPPLPSFNLERERMREYYQDQFECGFEYAYAYPAMAKAVQAAGRVIRSETDKGLIVLMDNRFALPNFSNSMPQDWYGEHPGELVSTSILQDVSTFWESVTD
jgi:DNA excision repair protein ERCC-2